MRITTIRIHEDTIFHIDKAAKKAGVKRGTLIRHSLEQIYDGTPHNPLGVTARPAFYNALCEAIAVMCISGDSLSPMDRKIAKKKAQEVRRELEIDHEYL